MQGKKETLLKRLEEIRNTVLEELSDDQVLEILAERKKLVEDIKLLEKKESEEKASQKHLEEEHAKIEKEIGKLNKEIGPDKEDEELLELVSERKELEEELLMIEKKLGQPLPEASEEEQEQPATEEPVPEEVPAVEEAPAEEPLVPEPAEETVATEEVPEEAPAEAETQPEEVPVEEPKPAPKKSIFKEEAFGTEGIQTDSQATEEYSRFLPQLETNRESLGSFLQDLPHDVRANKAFMLKVAAIDPAYAMHYAMDDLRTDESFLIKVAGTKNMRNSGNALAEMSPEMRTGPVVLAGVRHDFRNARFVLPSMAEYDEILSVAKKGALEKVKDLKEAADVTFLIPKVLQKDKAFMEEVKQVAQK